jgi:hypothetical protein
MPSVHEAGPLFVHTVRLKPGTPFIHRAPTNEIEEPFRHSRSVIFNLFRRGVVVGVWRKTDRDPEDALLDALDGQVIQEAAPLKEWASSGVTEASRNPHPYGEPA